MAEYFGEGIRYLLVGAGIGGLAVPFLCFSLRTILRKLGYLLPTNPKPNSHHERQSSDQLQGIEGVGPQIAVILANAGLSSFAAVADKNPAAIKAILDNAGPQYKLANPATWPEQARLLARGDIEGFLKLAIKLTAGVTVLENIVGIGAALGERLRLGGINTVTKLGKSSVSDVQDALEVTGTSADATSISRWITQASEFTAGKSTALAELAGNLQRADLPASAAAALSGPVQDEHSSSEYAPLEDTPKSWLRENAAPVCVVTLSALLLIGSELLPRSKPNEHYFTQDCMLDGRTTFQVDSLFYKDNTTLIDPRGKVKIDSYVKELLNEAAQNDNKPSRILIIGFASVEGKPKHNQLLSERRAKAIEKRLQSETGWPTNLFKSFGRGAIEADACDISSEFERESCLEKDRKIDVTVSYDKINPQTAKRVCTGWRKVDRDPISVH